MLHASRISGDRSTSKARTPNAVSPSRSPSELAVRRRNPVRPTNPELTRFLLAIDRLQWSLPHWGANQDIRRQIVSDAVRVRVSVGTATLELEGDPGWIAQYADDLRKMLDRLV